MGCFGTALIWDFTSISNFQDVDSSLGNSNFLSMIQLICCRNNLEKDTFWFDHRWYRWLAQLYRYSVWMFGHTFWQIRDQTFFSLTLSLYKWCWWPWLCECLASVRCIFKMESCMLSSLCAQFIKLPCLWLLTVFLRLENFSPGWISFLHIPAATNFSVRDELVKIIKKKNKNQKTPKISLKMYHIPCSLYSALDLGFSFILYLGWHRANSCRLCYSVCA